jgi:RNA polymerase primary sigma factor
MSDAGSDGRIKKRVQNPRAAKTLKKAKPAKETDPLALYFKQISKFPLLTVQEEQSIGEKIGNTRTKLRELDLAYTGNEQD